MADNSDSFIAKSTIKAADLEHRRKINYNIGKYNAVVPQGKSQFADVHLLAGGLGGTIFPDTICR